MMRFTDFLLIATVLTGLIWLIDWVFFRAQRKMQVLPERRGVKSTIPEPVLVEYARAFFPILLLVLIFRSFIIEPFRIPSGSMHPTLYEGDFIVVDKFSYGPKLPLFHFKLFNLGSPKRGDVIIFKRLKQEESMDMIKRVVGLPGDRIQYKNNRIYINDVPVKQNFEGEVMDKDETGKPIALVQQYQEFLDSIQHTIFVHVNRSHDERAFPYNDVVVPPDSYFVMGDNRDNSQDSRSWGFVHDTDILGRAFGIWMSWDSNQSTVKDWLLHSIRFNRIGLKLNTNTGTDTSTSLNTSTSTTASHEQK